VDDARGVSSFRRDPFTGGAVLVVPSRRGVVPFGGDPGAGLPQIPGTCPFCPGNEGETEHAIAAVPAAGPWRVRVVRNKWPLVDGAGVARADGGALEIEGTGAHEIVVESARHDVDLADLSDAELAEVLGVYRARVRAHEATRGVAHVAVFKNKGRRAGATQPHPHGQVVVTPLPGPDVERRAAAARVHHERTGARLLDAEIERARTGRERLVETGDAALAFTPFAPRQPHAVIVAPCGDAGAAPFADVPDEGLAAFAPVLRRTLARARAVTGDSDYNLVLRLPPAADARAAWASWYVDVLPRRAAGAGFEAASGFDVVTVSPEESAAALRAAAT
jgi:UDPglucose--hexose-1-phosphate uridylyltransferase